MKTLIVLVLGLLAVGCTSLRDSVLGEYEYKHSNGITYKDVFLDNGVWEWYRNDKKALEAKWSIVKGEIHVKYDSELIVVWRINKDKSITIIADIYDGKRTAKEDQNTYKKIK